MKFKSSYYSLFSASIDKLKPISTLKTSTEVSRNVLHEKQPQQVAWDVPITTSFATKQIPDAIWDFFSYFVIGYNISNKKKYSYRNYYYKNKLKDIYFPWCQLSMFVGCHCESYGLFCEQVVN